MEQAVVKRPGIYELVAGTWRSALGALLGLLPLLAVVTAALFGLNYVFPMLEQKLAVVRPASSSLLVLMVVPGAWVFGLEKLAIGLAAVPAALATHRRILVDDGPHLAPGPLLRFWLWALTSLVLSLGALYVSGLAATPDLQLVSYVLKGFAIAIPFLLLPVFPAVAAGERAASPIARIDKALGRWDGNFWRFIALALLTVGPGLLLMRLPDAIIQRHSGGSADAAQQFDASLVGSVVQSALLVLVVVIAAAALSRFYQFSNLPRPVKRPLGAAHETSAAHEDSAATKNS
jgi:hypothetical protein